MEKKYHPIVGIEAHLFKTDRGGLGIVPCGAVCTVVGIASHNGDVSLYSHQNEAKFSVSEAVFNKWFLPINE